MGIYDRDWYKNSNKKQETVYGFNARPKKTRIHPILIFLIIIIASYILFHNLGYAYYFGNTMPNNYIRYLKQVDIYKEELRAPMITISDQHRLPLHERNSEVYRQALLEGIVACENAKKGLETIKSPKGLEELHSINKNYIANTQAALKHYLEFTYSKKNSDLDLGNTYLQKANENKNENFTKLIQVMERNNIKYEILEDGSLRYWYKGLYHIPE